MLNFLRKKKKKQIEVDVAEEVMAIGTAVHEKLDSFRDSVVQQNSELLEERDQLLMKVNSLTEELTEAKEEISALKKQLAPKKAVDEQFNKIDLWD